MTNSYELIACLHATHKLLPDCFRMERTQATAGFTKPVYDKHKKIPVDNRITESKFPKHPRNEGETKVNSSAVTTQTNAKNREGAISNTTSTTEKTNRNLSSTSPVLRRMQVRKRGNFCNRFACKNVWCSETQQFVVVTDVFLSNSK